MSSPNAPAGNGTAPDSAAGAAEGGRGTEVRFHYSPSFPDVLEQAGCSLLISTYQAGQLGTVGAADGELTFSFRRFDQAMGVAVGPDEIAVAGREQVWLLRDHSDLAPAIEPAGRFDRCWLPRTTTVTGAIQCHEIAWGTTNPLDHGGEDGRPDLWIVNTLFSCLAGIDPRNILVKSEVSRICADLDEQVACFADRDLSEQPFPYVFLDATYCKARVGGARNGTGSRVVSQAVVVTTGVSVDGRREVLGFAVGDSEDGAFWKAFLRSLKARGLTETKLVISDAHAGLKAAIAAVMLGAAWQRCRDHFLRNILVQVPKGSQEMVAAAIRTIFAQPDADHVREQLDVIATMLGRQFPTVETSLREAADDITAFADLPVSH